MIELILRKLNARGQDAGTDKESRAVFFWLPLWLLGAYLDWELLRRFTALPPGFTDVDVPNYQRVGEAILAGEVPYRDFFIEYPPGSLPAFVLPALFDTSQQTYARLFGLEMALILVATLVLTAYTARSLGRFWLLPAVVFIAATLLLYPVAMTRYDAVVAVTLAASMALSSSPAFSRNGAAGAAAFIAAWASLGFGAAAKLVPALATLPLALLSEGARRVAWGFSVFFGVISAFFLPSFLFGEDFVDIFTYHFDRGLQVESLAASVLMKLGRPPEPYFEYGSWNMGGQGMELLSSMSLPIMGILLVITATVMYREYRKDRFGPEQFPRFATALVLAFLIGSKVLSPQYIIWLLPLVPLSISGAWGLVTSALFLGVCWLTTQVYPHHYTEVVNGQAPGTDILLGRNLLLVVLLALMLSLPSGESRPADEQSNPS